MRNCLRRSEGSRVSSSDKKSSMPKKVWKKKEGVIQTIATIKEEPKKKQEGKDLQECWSITEVEEQKPSTIEVQKYSPLATKTKTKNFFKQESNQRYHLKLNIFGQLVPKNYFHRRKKTSRKNTFNHPCCRDTS